MFARMSTFEGRPERVGEAIRHFQDEAIPAMKKMHGFKDAYLMVDRKSGKAVAITMWESEEALQSSATSVTPLRSQAAQALDASKQPKVEVYEVAVSGVPSASIR